MKPVGRKGFWRNEREMKEDDGVKMIKIQQHKYEIVNSKIKI